MSDLIYMAAVSLGLALAACALFRWLHSLATAANAAQEAKWRIHNQYLDEMCIRETLDELGEVSLSCRGTRNGKWWAAADYADTGWAVEVSGYDSPIKAMRELRRKLREKGGPT